MTVRSIVVLTSALSLITTVSLSSSVAEDEAPCVIGLWRLVAAMPAGVVAHEALVPPSDQLQYWFTQDQTVTVSREPHPTRKLKKGVWSQRGNRLLVSWEDGSALDLVIVRATRNGLIVAGFDLRPIWYRFSRVF
ncbi:MAG: hypothetical protein LDL33_07390 [Desulfomonile sp.]|nr:hypothetical protein [Desulfomonile sp.]